jgi:hypothetical protein
VSGSGSPSNPDIVGIVGIVWAGDDSPNLVEPDRM